jgi:2-keto-4-pentenoate hydratase/2-oxohepta-3-ene-1,7-dioic acid hydratase in catechol pathway
VTDRLYRIERQNGSTAHVVERDGRWLKVEGDVFGAFTLGSEVERNGARILPPVMPSKIVAIGLNYRDHAIETNKPLPEEPMLFLKPPTAVIGSGDRIVRPSDVGRVDYEAELGVVIGRRAHRVRREDAAQYVLGAICVNDVTARDLQSKDIQFTRAKGFDTFAPIGPCIALGLDTSDLAVEAWVNGRCRQSSRTRELVFDVPALVAFISRVMTLLPGDIISTGTPSGIGPLMPGDRVKIKVEGVGELDNPVIAEE